MSTPPMRCPSAITSRIRGFVANLHPCPFCGLEKLFDDDAAASDRLDTGRAGDEIIDRSDEFDAVGLQPSNRCDRVLRKRAKIVSISQSAGHLKHIVFETGAEPIRCGEPHVRRTPAGISACFVFTRFFKQCNFDLQAAAAGLLGGRGSGCEAGSSMSDDDQLLRISRHRWKSPFWT